MPQALKDGARATVNGEVREFSPAKTQRTPTVPPAISGPPQAGRPAGRPLVSVQISPDLQQAIAIAGRLGDIGEKTTDLLGKVGVVAALGLAAYGGYQWYKKSQRPARRPKARRVRAELTSGGK